MNLPAAFNPKPETIHPKLERITLGEKPRALRWTWLQAGPSPQPMSLPAAFNPKPQTLDPTLYKIALGEKPKAFRWNWLQAGPSPYTLNRQTLLSERIRGLSAGAF